MSIRWAIADAVNESREWGRINADDISEVTFRKGCAEIDVEFFEDGTDNPISDLVTIDAAPVLTRLLRWAMHTEVTHDDD